MLTNIFCVVDDNNHTNTSINKDYKTPLLLVLPMCSLCSCENVWTDNSISSAIKNAYAIPSMFYKLQVAYR